MKYFVLLLMILMFNQKAEAQYTGPSASAEREMTVADVLDNARMLNLRDTQVQLQGFLVEHIREDYFWFEDSSGRVRIEVYGDVMPAVPFDESTRVFITGEVDFNLLFGTYIWVKQLSIADTTDL